MRASAMNKKKCVRQLQLDLEAQTMELNQLEARIKHRSYKLSKATLQELHYQEACLKDQLTETKSQLAEAEDGKDSVGPTKNLHVNIVMLTGILVAICLHLLLWLC